jgi:hypothetical protein
MESPSRAYAVFTRAGDSFARSITVEDENGDQVSLAGASVEWSLSGAGEIRQFEDDARASVSGDEVLLRLTPEETRELFEVSRVWRYEVTLEFSSGDRLTVLDGLLHVVAEVVA